MADLQQILTELMEFPLRNRGLLNELPLTDLDKTAIANAAEQIRQQERVEADKKFAQERRACVARKINAVLKELEAAVKKEKP